MNIMFFSAQYLPTVGGVERYTNSIAKELIKLGHSITVVTSALDGLSKEELDESGVQIIRLPVWKIMNGRFPFLKFSKGKSDFKRYFGNNKPDFVVIQTRFYSSSIMAARLCKKNNVPCIVIEHGSAYLLRDGLIGVRGKIYEQVFCRYVHSLCGSFYGVSGASCKWLENFGIKTDNTLYNSVDVKKVIDRAENGKLEIEKILPDNIKGKKIIFSSSRFIPEKGVEQLADAFLNFYDENKDYVLIMAGDGPLWDKISKKQYPGVYLTGNLSYEVNLALMRMAEMYVLPTFSEGFATTVLEAAALKTLIVTTPTGGSPQLILDDSFGILIPDMSRNSIYEGIKKATNPNYDRVSAVNNTYINLINNFTWKITAKKLEKIAIERTK